MSAAAVQDDVFSRYRVIDTDSHITEPADVWTSRVASKWRDRVPQVKNMNGVDVWLIDGTPAGAPGAYSVAGFDGTYPKFPATYEECPPATYDAKARLAHLDAEGLYAQVVYPNVGGFGSGGFQRMGEPELVLECVRAYNDFMIDWTSADPKRLIPTMALPFWDVRAAVEEIERAARIGHKTVLMCGSPEAWDQPVVSHKHWDPIWAAARAADLSISFHIGGGDITEIMNDRGEIGTKSNFARFSSLCFIDNSRCIAELIFGGVCHRFPDLDFISVESGVGWLPFTIEAFDWQWKNNGVREEHPEYDLLPSEYFERQIYGCFWFESQGLPDALAKFPDNFMYETDYPHPTCQAPGPKSAGTHPRLYADRALEGVPEDVVRKVLQDTAARLYRLDLDA